MGLIFSFVVAWILIQPMIISDKLFFFLFELCSDLFYKIVIDIPLLHNNKYLTSFKNLFSHNFLVVF